MRLHVSVICRAERVDMLLLMSGEPGFIPRVQTWREWRPSQCKTPQTPCVGILAQNSHFWQVWRHGWLIHCFQSTRFAPRDHPPTVRADLEPICQKLISVTTL